MSRSVEFVEGSSSSSHGRDSCALPPGVGQLMLSDPPSSVLGIARQTESIIEDSEDEGGYAFTSSLLSLMASTEGGEGRKKKGRPPTKVARYAAELLAERGQEVAELEPISESEPSNVPILNFVHVGPIAADESAVPSRQLAMVVSPDAGYGTHLQALHKSFHPHCNLAAILEHAATQPDMSFDERTLKVGKYILDNEKHHLASGIVEADLLDMGHKQMKQRMRRLAAALVHTSLFRRRSLCRMISSHLSSASKLAFVEGAMYDETPMKTILRHQLHSQTKDGDALPPHVYDLPSKMEIKPSMEIGKILQTQSMYSGLVKVPGGEYLVILASDIQPLQSLRNTTGESCLHRQTWCQHKRGIALATDKTYEDLIPHDVAGVIHLALSLGAPGAMDIFREALLEVVKERLVMKVGSPRPAALEHKCRILRMSMSTSTNSAEKQAILYSVLNGDWFNTAEIEFYPGFLQKETVNDKEQVVNLVHAALCSTIAGSKPSLWPRSRWTGADASINSIAILEHVHGLLSLVYAKFAKMNQRSKTSTFTSHPAQSFSELALPHDHGDDLFHFATLAAEVNDEPMVDDARPHTDTSPQDLSAAKNSKDREMALQWLHTFPLARLILMQVTLQPLEKLRAAQFQLGSKPWELQQMASQSDAGRGVGSFLHRDFPILKAALGTMEETYFKELQKLFLDQGPWKCMPSSAFTISMRCLGFRVLARQGAAIEQIIAAEHRKFPTRTFTLLKHPDLAPQICAAPACVKDNFTIGLEKQFPGLTGKDVLMVLALHASMQNTDIGAVEATHASIRRHACLSEVNSNKHAVPRGCLCPVLFSAGENSTCKRHQDEEGEESWTKGCGLSICLS
eukprot:5518161-Amphidinium_carterae.5